MKYSVKRKLNYTHIILNGLFILIFSTLISLQAQTSVKDNFEKGQASPSVVLVPDGFAVVSSTGDGIAATVRIVDVTQFGNLWTNTANHAPTNYLDTTGEMPLYQTWTTALFQNQVMHGLAVSFDGTTIYTSAHAYVPSGDKTPNIYRITSFAPTPATLLTTLPGGGNYGVGAIDLDETHNLIFASNMDDGKIYRIQLPSGMIFDSFDPLGADASGTNLPPLGERVISVAYHRLENRLYYSVWGASANTVRSIGLTAGGAFNASSDDRLEFTIPNSSAPAGDIEFNIVGNRMLLAEEPLINNSPTLITLGAHFGRVLEYVRGTTGFWTPDPVGYGGSTVKYEAGRFSNRANSRGGITFVYSAPVGNTVNGNERFVLFTCDALNFPTPAVYGFQFTPSSGGSVGGGSLPSNSLAADLDYDIGIQDKYVYGDVDIRKTVAPTSGEVSVGGRITDASGNGVGKIPVTLTQQDGTTINALTNPFGYYRFENVPVEQIVVVTPASKHYTFNPSTQAVLVEEDTDTVNFTAEN